MSKPHEGQGQPGAKLSRNPFVRFQKGFERRFNQFREGYGALLEQAIARRNTFVMISLAIALASLSLFFFLGRDYFPEIRSNIIIMHMRAPLGTRIEVSGRIATLVSTSIEELLPVQVENVVSNCGLPVARPLWGSQLF
jgi:multidrug efflux pump subunit AcrB